MDILWITHSFPRHRGDAAGSFLLRLAVALGELGVRVHVLAPSAPGYPVNEVLDGVPVHRHRYAPEALETLAYTGQMVESVRGSLGGKLALAGLLLSGAVAARKLRERIRPAVVHAHWSFPGGLIGALSHGDVPLVTTLHGTDVRLAAAGIAGRAAFRRVIAASATVTTVSTWLAARAEALSPGLRAIVAPMPVATDLFSPDGARDPRRLLFVGRVTEQKGVPSLLAAVAAMRTRVQLDLVGDGPDTVNERSRAAALGIADRVTWHGALSPAALLPLYRRAAALVVPSRDEGLGLVAVEAQLCATPVVAFDSGGLPDVVAHDRTGVLVPAGDVPALASALDALLADPARAATLGDAGRLAALDRFTPRAVAERYADIYRNA